MYVTINHSFCDLAARFGLPTRVEILFGGRILFVGVSSSSVEFTSGSVMRKNKK